MQTVKYDIFSSHTRRKKTDLQFQILNIYYTKESPRNKEYDKYPYFKHVVAGEGTLKSQDELVGYYALKTSWRKVVHRKVYTCFTSLNLFQIGPVVRLSMNQMENFISKECCETHYI